MAIIVNDGWLELSDGTDTLLLMFKECKVDVKLKPKMFHLLGGGNVGIDMGSKYLVFKVKSIYANGHTDFSNAIKYLLDWQDVGTFTIKVRRDNVPNYVSFDGTNTSWIVLMPNGIQGISKLEAGPSDGVYNVADMIIFEQAG